MPGEATKIKIQELLDAGEKDAGVFMDTLTEGGYIMGGGEEVVEVDAEEVPGAPPAEEGSEEYPDDGEEGDMPSMLIGAARRAMSSNNPGKKKEEEVYSE